MTKILVCIELPSQVPAALNAVRRGGISNCSILALTPHVEYALDKTGRAYRRPEDYHSEEDINAVGLQDLATLEQLCTTVDDFLQDQWALLKQEGLRPATLNWYSLKNLVNSISIRAFIFRRILEKEQPDQVLCFGTREEPVARDLFFMHESAWARVIPAVSRALGVPWETLGDSADPSVLNRCPGAQGAGRWGRMRGVVRDVLGPSGIRGLRGTYRRVNLAKRRLATWLHRGDLPSRPTVLVLDRGYSLGLLLRQLEAQGSFNGLYWDAHWREPPYYLNHATVPEGDLGLKGFPLGHVPRDHGSKLWAEARTLPELHGMLCFSGIDCFPILERRLQRFFQFDIPDMVNTYLRARALLQAQRPCVVMASTTGDHSRQAVAAAATKEGIPFVVYQHGASGGHVMMESWPNEIIRHTDLQAADYTLVFGQGDVSYLERCKGSRTRFVPVGSAALDDLKKQGPALARERLRRKFQLATGEKTVIYVPTSMDGNIRVAPYRGRSPSRMFQMERRMLEVFSEFPAIRFVVKTHTSPYYPCSPIAQVVKDWRLKNCMVVDEPFTSLLPLADMFVTDYPATSFLEMLTTDRPILCCGYQLPWPWTPGKWHPSVLEMWRERVVYADDLEEFLELLRTHLREERFQPVGNNNALLKLFGTHLDDGCSAQRAHAFLESLAAERTAGQDLSPMIRVGVPTVGGEHSVTR